ncbi:MAG: hypothetical protein IKZ09_00030, partial [Clostridia bacterium]|nr:hypothetical protein [Clostridia bacterium]
MKAYDILEALGEIDDTLLAACEDYTTARAARRKTWMCTAAGVCAVLLLAVGIRVLPALQRVSSDTAAPEMDSATEIMQTEAAVENENDSPLYSGADNAGGIIPPVGSSPSDALRDEIAQEPPLKNTEATPLPEEAEESPVVEAPAVDEAPAEVPAEDDVEITVSTAEKVETEADTDAQLPMLSVGFADGGYGFEGILLYEDDIRCNDPLLDVYGTPEALPVYENLAYSDMSGTPLYLSDDAMLRMGLDCAEMLGFAVLSQETTYRGDDVDIDGDIVRLETDGGEIEVQGDGLITIRLDRAVILPDGLALGDDTDIETAEESIVYLTRHFGMLLADAEYQPVITLSRSFDGEAHRTFSAYPIGETAADNYLNKSFALVTFYCCED